MNQSPRRNLQRSRSDRMLAGVCGGIAATTGLDSTIVRLLAVLVILSSMGSGLLLYFILALVMPLEPVAMGTGSESLAGTVDSPAVTDSVQRAQLPAASPTVFTPDELRRWDLPGAAEVARPAAAPAETVAESVAGPSAAAQASASSGESGV